MIRRIILGPGYLAALAFLREATRSPDGASVHTVMIRAAVQFPDAADLLTTLPLKTGEERHQAVQRAAMAVAIALDDPASRRMTA